MIRCLHEASCSSKYGNLASIILDEDKKISTALRQTITKKLGHDESVFINDVSKGEVSIFSPKREVKFAGHAMVGAAWFLNRSKNNPIKKIHCLGGTIKVWQEKDITWVRANLNMMPDWNFKQLESAEAVERISHSESAEMAHTFVWACINKSRGIIRARTFAPDWGIPESQGNGSGSMLLASMLKQKLEIKHGDGSVIFANSFNIGQADLGGKVIAEPAQKIILDNLD